MIGTMLELPPWPYHSILAGVGLIHRPAVDSGDLVTGRKLLELEENAQLLDGIGTRGIPFGYTFVALAHDGLILRSGQRDAVHTALSLYRELKGLAEAKGTYPWIDPNGNTLRVSVHDFQERRLGMAAPAWDITLTLILRDPYPSDP